MALLKKGVGVGADILEALATKPAAKSKGFTGWHGTDATFWPTARNPLGEFNEDVLKSGEGTQAYGWGHYLTDAPQVGRQYRDANDVDNVNFDVFEDLLAKYQKLINNPKATPEDYEKAAVLEQILLDGDLQGVISRGKEAYGEAGWNYLKKEIEPNFSREGSLYEVNVNASKDDLLKWDDGLTNQPKTFTSKIEEMAKDGVRGIDPNSPYMKDVKGWELYNDLRDQFEDEVDIALRDGALSAETPLLKIIDYPIDDLRMRDPLELHQELASRYLEKKGVKGIQFPAQEGGATADGAAQGGTVNNYVIFNKDTLDIAKKYGFPLAVSMGGIAAVATPQEAEAGIWSPLQKAGNLILRPADIGYDSRFLVKGSGKTGLRGGEAERANALTVGVESRGNQKADAFNWADAVGRGYVLGEADRTMAGGLITDVNGVKLNFPVDMRGGQGFPLDTQGYGWASDKGAVTGLLGKLTEAAEGTGKNPLMLPFTMAPSGGDFAPFNGNVMLSYANAAMDKKTKKALDAAIKKIDKTWVGIDSPMQQVWFDSANPSVRGKIVNLLDKDFRNKGGLSLSEARLSVTAPDQLNTADSSLQSVIEIDLGKGTTGRMHPAYDTTMHGQSLGTADRGSAFDIAGDYVNKKGERFGDKWPTSGQEFNSLQGKPKTDANYALLRTKPYGLITEQIAERLSNAPINKPTAGLLALIGAAGANADARPMPTGGGQLKNTVRNAVFGAPQAQIPAGFYNQTGGMGVAQAPAQNPVSQGAEYVAGKLHSGARNLQNAGILSMLSDPLASLGDIASRAAYGESKVTDPAEALLSASAFAPQLYFGGKTINAMRDKDIQSMLFRQVFGD